MHSTTTSAPATVRATWSNPGEPVRLTIERIARGRPQVTHLGQRAMLTLGDAAAALGNRPIAYVRRAIRAGLLRARRRNGRYIVSVKACRDFFFEEQADLAAAVATRHERHYPADEVFRELDD